MRGKAPCGVQGQSPCGITPAYAGKSSHQHGAGRWRRDHPRVCGEKAVAHIWWYSWIGSPPRVRGKAAFDTGHRQVEGITPAYAGKSILRMGMFAPYRDHPRVCGEKIHQPLPCRGARGSPPRVRGKVPYVSMAALAQGITPAYAGKSARRQAGPPGPAPPPQMRLGWSPPPCTGRQCRTRKSTHARRARIPVPAHTPAPQ